jgi:hypothetical protein
MANVNSMKPTEKCPYQDEGFDDCAACGNCILDMKADPPVYSCTIDAANGDEIYEPEPVMPWE